MLEAKNLEKSYGAIKAVDGVSISLEPGKILGLLGPNGAGKSTTVSMLCGLIQPDAGEVLIDGKPVASDDDPVKKMLGLVPQDIALYENLTARDNLRLFGALYGLTGSALERAIADALDLVGLTDRAKDRVATFSGGMQRRLNLAAGLLHDPAVLLLDEPTVGVDPQSRNAIFERVEELKRRGKAILYTTHYMEEAERLCDQIVILDAGKVIASGTMAELSERMAQGNRLTIELENPCSSNVIDTLRALAGVQGAECDGRKVNLLLTNLTLMAPMVLGVLAENDCHINHLTSERAGLAEIFLTLTGRSLRDQ